jgi:probable rRNA maturation factor
MVVSQKPTVAVEFNLQDGFFQNLSSETSGPIPLANWKYWFEIWLESLSSKIPAADSYEVTLRLTTDQEIQTLNAQYRHQNKPTDVLSFAALEVDMPTPSAPDYSSEPLYLGDIIISVEAATRQAQQQGHPLATELVWLASHGLLHLLGWDHPDEGSLVEMLSQQVALLKMVGHTPDYL